MEPQKEKVEIRRRHLPHWTQDGAIYFLTFRVMGGKLSIPEQKLVLEHVKDGQGKFYELAAAVVMPDHAHIVLKPNERQTLSNVLKGIKGVSAHKLNSLRGTTGSIWQDESFDRIIRDEKELLEKLNYILNNPIKKGLTDDPWQYHGFFYNFDFEQI